jgi:hypothetical protein
MDVYATHLPVLNFLRENLPSINKVFEFGCGYNSTPLFLQICDHLTMVEMQSEEWYDKISKEFKRDYRNWDAILALGPDKGIEIFKGLKHDFDIVFVDGHGDTRWKCVNEAFKKSSVIVAHDFETSSYQWYRIEKPDNWVLKINKKGKGDPRLSPWTAVFYNQELNLDGVEHAD